MMEIVLHVEAPIWRAQGVKESVAMAAEEWGLTRVVSVRELPKTGGNDDGNV